MVYIHSHRDYFTSKSDKAGAVLCRGETWDASPGPHRRRKIHATFVWIPYCRHQNMLFIAIVVHIPVYVFQRVQCMYYLVVQSKVRMLCTTCFLFLTADNTYSVAAQLLPSFRLPSTVERQGLRRWGALLSVTRLKLLSNNACFRDLPQVLGILGVPVRS